MERYYLNYLKSISVNDLQKKYLDMLKVELDWNFYADGQDLAKKYHRRTYLPVKWQLYKRLQEIRMLFSVPRFMEDDIQILSTFRFPCQLDHCTFFSPISNPVGLKNIIGNRTILKGTKLVDDLRHKYPFNRMLSKEVFSKLEDYEKDLHTLFFKKYNIRALFLYTDQFFHSKQQIEIFKKANRPSFIFVHGLPAYYTIDVDSKADYLMVWGEQMKQNYVNAGFDKNKIIVTGNFRYMNVTFHKKLRNSTDNVLVITSSTKIWHQDTWDSIPIISDPGATLLYLLQIENVLRRLGVKHARLRPHPSVDTKWLLSIVDDGFFEIDTMPLVKSLQQSTLVVGPTSSVAIDALINGVNYIAYEPCDSDGYNFLNRKLAPPFDGSDPYLQVVNTEKDLLYLIGHNYCSSTELLQEYIQPFNPQLIRNLI